MPRLKPIIYLAHTPEYTEAAEKMAESLREQGYEVVTSKEAAKEAGILKEWEKDEL